MARDYSLSVAAAMWRYAEDCADKERRNTIMTTKIDIDQERAAFEAWHKAEMWIGGYDPKDHDTDAYVVSDSGFY